MSVIFEKGMDKTISTYEKWWQGLLDRPLIPIVVTGHEPDRKPPSYPYEGQRSFANMAISPHELIDSIDYELCKSEFLGDSFPHCNGIYSGPGIVAAFLGANVVLTGEGNIWFENQLYENIEDIHFSYDPHNPWLERVKAIMVAGYERWGNKVVIGTPDLGGVLDILASFRGTQNLLLDLYDSPDEVLRLVGEIKQFWHMFYQELAQTVPHHCYSDWSNILSVKPSYMLQCDFSYMLGTPMFDKFAKQELLDTCSFLERGCYHLDGIGQIAHLDSLLQIDTLKLVQWIPGAGTVDPDNWQTIYMKILSAGKHLQIVCDANDNCIEQLDNIISIHGSGKKIILGQLALPASQRAEALQILARYGA